MAPQLPVRQLGKDGPKVTALGWGAMGLSIAYSEKLPDDERFALLDQIYEAGEHFWDSGRVSSREHLRYAYWQEVQPICTVIQKICLANGSRRIPTKERTFFWPPSLLTREGLMVPFQSTLRLVMSSRHALSLWNVWESIKLIFTTAIDWIGKRQSSKQCVPWLNSRTKGRSSTSA